MDSCYSKYLSVGGRENSMKKKKKKEKKMIISIFPKMFSKVIFLFSLQDGFGKFLDKVQT